MNSKQAVITSIQSAQSQGQISASAAEAMLEQLDDIAVAGCAGVSPDDIDSEEVTLVSVVIDESSSMSPYQDAVIKAYNDDFLKPVQGAKNAESILVSTWIFADAGDPAKMVRLLHSYTPVKDCPKLTKRDYNPNGMTPLYKAAHNAMTGIMDYGNTLLNSGTRVKRIVIVLSDGEENASRGFSSSQIKKISSGLLKTESCVLAYVFFGEEKEGDRWAADIGFPAQHRLTEDVRTQGDKAIRRVFGTISASVISASQSRVSAAGLSANAFFAQP